MSIGIVSAAPAAVNLEPDTLATLTARRGPFPEDACVIHNSNNIAEVMACENTKYTSEFKIALENMNIQLARGIITNHSKLSFEKGDRSYAIQQVEYRSGKIVDELVQYYKASDGATESRRATVFWNGKGYQFENPGFPEVRSR
jgi:hypothetical protein